MAEKLEIPHYLTFGTCTPVGEAAGVAKSALGKLGKTISDTVTAMVPQPKQAPPQRSSQRQRYGRSDNEYGRLYPWYATSPVASSLPRCVPEGQRFPLYTLHKQWTVPRCIRLP